MSIQTITTIQAAYQRACEQNPLADTEDVLQIVADQYGVSPEAVAEAVEQEQEA